MMDIHAKHQRVMRHFIEKVHPTVQLSEYDPQALGMPGSTFQWSDYDLLLIDNELGEIDGIKWLKSIVQEKDFPPFIVVSSTQETDTPAAMEAVIRSIRMGAVNYLFKKKIQLAQLNENIIKVLEKAPKRPDAKGRTGKQARMNTAQQAVQNIQAAVEDTQHEIQLAMAMMEGHSEWPFTIEDILAGNAFIADYKVVSYMGSEMGGATFKVKREGLDEPQVMYYIHRHKNEDGSMPDYLYHELDVMRGVDHPNILPIEDYQLHGDAILVIRELIGGETLEKRLKTQGVYEEQAINFFRQILAGLGELHEHKVTVGHFTPKSLRVNSKGELVFADTGLLNRLHAINEVTSEVANRDAPMYATPEQVQGRTLDRRSDIYIAGLIGFEMVAGAPAYYKGSVKDILYAHVAEPIPDLPDKTSGLNYLFHEMLQKTPSKRIQDTQSVLLRLDSLMNSSA